MQIKFKDRSLNQPLIASNSHENPMWQNQQGMSGPGKKAPMLFLFFFFFSPKKQKIEHQSASNSAFTLTPSWGKTSLCCVALKIATSFLPASML
jgi:hypothetical protein